MRVLLHHFWQDSSIQSCIFRQQAIPQRSENWYFTMNLHIIVIGISGIRCFFEPVQQYTGLIRVNKKDHRLYRQLLLRTVAMNNQIPYVTASLNDSGMVFKDRILYMVNIRKLRRGILPGILVTVLLAGSNLVFNVSAGTDTVPTRTERTGQRRKCRCKRDHKRRLLLS